MNTKHSRVPNGSMDDSTINDNISQKPSKYNLLHKALFQPKIDRRLNKVLPTRKSREDFALLKSRSPCRYCIGTCVFSKALEKVNSFLILGFCVFMFSLVGVGGEYDDLDLALRIIGLVFLCLFLSFTLLKFFAVGTAFLSDAFNIMDVGLLFAGICASVYAFFSEAEKKWLVTPNLAAKLLMLAVMIRKVGEHKAMHIKSKRSIRPEISVEMVSERVLDILNIITMEPWIRANKDLLDDVRWCMDVISTNKLNEPVISNKEDLKSFKETDLINLVKLFSSAPKPRMPGQNGRQRTNSVSESRPLTELDPGMPSETLKCLVDIDSNRFNVFKLKELTGNNELTTLAHIFFSRTQLFEKTGIHQEMFSNFIDRIQSGYNENVIYHNATHAADVLQSLHYFYGSCGTGDFLMINPVELAGSYLAAAVHDFEHPGRNNNFLINTQAELAIRYNDKSVLESHHISSSFALTMNEEFDLFFEMAKDDYLRIRSLMIEMVLSTDIAQHFSILTRFKNKFISLSFAPSTEDRDLMMSLLLHAADISNPSKPWELCQKWTMLLIQEYWLQGDTEKNIGMPVSYMMDRHTVNIAKTQVGFIDVIVQPLFTAFYELFPVFEDNIMMLDKNRERWEDRVEVFQKELEADAPSP